MTERSNVDDLCMWATAGDSSSGNLKNGTHRIQNLATITEDGWKLCY